MNRLTVSEAAGGRRQAAGCRLQAARIGDFTAGQAFILIAVGRLRPVADNRIMTIRYLVFPKNKKRSYVSVALSAMLLSPISQAEDRSTVELKFITEVEQRLTLLSGSHKLQEYARHYKFYGTRASSKVEAVFVFGLGSSGVKLLGKGELPRYLDGGCDILNLVLTRAGEIVSVRCNGIA